MGDLQRIHPGIKLHGIDSATWNRFADATQKTERTAIPPTTATGQSGRGYGCHCLIDNQSGGGRSAGEIVKIADPIVSANANPDAVYHGVHFKGTEPDAACEGGWPVAVLQSASIAGEIGAAVGVFLGATWAKVNVTDAAHEYAVPAATLFVLQSDASKGARILWKQAGTGEKWAVVLLGAPTPADLGEGVEVTVTSDVQYDATADKLQKKTQTMQVLDADAASAWMDVCGDTITICADVQYDATANQLQKKTQQITVLSADAASAWTNVCGTEITVLTAWRVDSSTPPKIQVKTRTVVVLEAGAESDWTDVHVTEDCP